jgi:nucleotide sugar dehydrogenase
MDYIYEIFFRIILILLKPIIIMMNFKVIHDKIVQKKLVISVLGLGRIGLPSAVIFAKKGFKVIGMDIDASLLNELKNSKTFEDEPHLHELLLECNSKNLIEYTTDVIYATKNSDFIIICVPTHINEDMGPDYSIVKNVLKNIGKHLKKNQIVIIESSISPTTTEQIIVPILEKESNMRLNSDFGVCSCPERADPGKIIENFDIVPRIVGGSNPEVTDIVVFLYQQITKAKIIKVSNPGTANAIKLTENIFRDVNIALINELSILYEMLGIDIKEVIQGCSTKYNFQPHYPGPGVGGPCLPANPYYIIKDAAKINYIPFLIRVAREINDRMPEHVKDLVIKSLNMANLPVKGTPICILGISYKADIKDIQISPSLKVIKFLEDLGADLKIYDPFYRDEVIEDYKIFPTIEEAMFETKAVAVLTDHSEFKEIDFDKIIGQNENLILIDARNIYNTSNLPKNTIYCGVGRPIMRY